jgi:glyoxylase I family protein
MAITAFGPVHADFTHVSVTVTQLEAARDFYGRVLGLSEIARPDFGFPGIWYDLGATLQLHIIVNEALTRPAAERDGFDIRYPHFAIHVEDADAAAEALAARGAKLHEFRASPTGLRQLFVKDPDGNMVEFIGPGAGTLG